MYDAWSAYDPRAIGTVLGSSLRRPVREHSDANKATATSFAAYRCLLNLFPAGAARLEAVMKGHGYDPNDGSTDVTRPQGIGNVAANAVIASRRNDGSNQYGDLNPGAYSDYTGYVPLNQPLPYCTPLTPGPCPPLNIANQFRWQPLINDVGARQAFIAPHWGRVKPFALSSGAQFDAQPDVLPQPDILNGPAAYRRNVDEMVQYSRDLDLTRKLIVEYWADGPGSELPPGHWALFAQFVSQRDRHTIDQDVKMFFAMHNASFDAGIVAWHVKRKFDGVRPITAVRFLEQGKMIIAWGGPGRPTRAIPGEKWTPYNPGSNLTPSFSGYISGHSTFSSASATVLRSFTGSDHFGYSTIIPANFGRVEPGVPPSPTPLSYATFSDATAEAGLSRLYGGIHFADDNTVGQRIGTLVGQQAWAKARSYFNAPAQGFAALALDGAKIKIDGKNERSGIFGDAAIGPSAKQELSRGFINGTLFVDPSAEKGKSANEVVITGGTVDRSLAQAVTDAETASATAATLAATRTLNDVRSSQTIVGDGGRNVIRVRTIELKGATLTLQGTSKVLSQTQLKV
jgi:hypothetical protein